MARKKYTVDLAEDERAELESFVSHGKRSAQAITLGLTSFSKRMRASAIQTSLTPSTAAR